MQQTGNAEAENDKVNMPVFELFPGVQVIKVSVRMQGFVEERRKSNRLEVNFCVDGRFECEFTKRDIAILKPGDMSVSMFDGKNGVKSYSCFPMGFYEGICIMADCDTATAWMKDELGRFAVDMNLLKETLLQKHWYWTGEAGLMCEHVMREIYDNIEHEETVYMQLKLVELFMLLGRLPRGRRERVYCPGNQLELVKHIRDHIITDCDYYSSAEQLAREHGMSSAQLQRLFREVYGMPIYRYLKEYRMEQAAVDLINTDAPVMEIAVNAGFTNASKFSESFRKRYGMNPTAYRKLQKQK